MEDSGRKNKKKKGEKKVGKTAQKTHHSSQIRKYGNSLTHLSLILKNNPNHIIQVSGYWYSESTLI